MYEFPPLAAKIAIVVCLYVFLFAAYRELYRTVKETRPSPRDRGWAPPPVDAPAAAPSLVLLEPTAAGGGLVPVSEHPLLSMTTIGRAEDNTVCLTDGSVSKYHARVDCLEGRFFVQDLRSRNGTLLNGRAVSTPVELTPGDQVCVGTVVLEFRA